MSKLNLSNKCSSKISVYFRQSANFSEFKNSESWIVLSPIEKQIKKKIEQFGTPLKDWDIRINYGIKTGFNEAFIIDSFKRKQLIEEDPKSAEIIRPLLRGRDIKRYSYEFADLYLITTFPSLKINIENYPAVKEHLVSFGYDRLKQTGDKGARKKTNNQWFETQDSISYWEDFSKQKIIYPNMTKYLPFLYDDKEFLTNQKCFIITGKNVEFLTAFFNSSLFKYCFRDNFPELQGGTRELSKIFLDKIPVLQVSENINLDYKKLVLKVQELKNKQLPTREIEIDKKIFELYSLTEEEKNTIGYVEIQ
ncbi:TaqI-like C-terminal specificity domain-containing protein [Chryseobacterium sp. VD8]|uniref:TaqI-like C-terminal specificity domain-containing protein n=1 Tax=Chryseobacterium sp. VD8 TaxID=3081254 RepID=UPI0030162D30